MADDPHAEQRAHWRGLRRRRPARLEPVGPGQESVWDYPRPPRVEAVARTLRVEFAGQVVAETGHGLRVVETASPPTYYFPPEDVRRELLLASPRTSFCEWKGVARYFDLQVGGRRSQAAAWSYPEPAADFEAIRDRLAFFAGRVDACFVGEERVRPQPGAFYGGWVTSQLRGPFKGEPGSEGW